MPVKSKRRVSRLDPTRTSSLRNAIARQVKRRFRRIKGELLKWLVVDDALGMRLKMNYDPDQPRNPDGTWGSGGGVTLHPFKISDDAGKTESTQFKTTLGNVPWGQKETSLLAAIRQEGSIFADITPVDVSIPKLIMTQPVALKSVLDKPNLGEGELNATKPIDVIRYRGNFYVQDGAHRVVRASQNGLDFVRARVFELPTLTTNAPATTSRFASSPEKLAAFQRWLRQQFRGQLTGRTEEELWRKYVQQGFQRGAGRAFDDVNASSKATGFKTQDFYDGGKQEFLRSAFGRPETREKVSLLASRTFADLENVTESMATRMGRVLADGLVAGANPRDVADDLVDELDIGYKRAEVIARTEIIRAHAEGQLDAFDRMGVQEIGVAVEWSTAGDDRVCDQCAPMEGVVLKVSEAHGMIPAHPQCRCAFIPANVGEDDEDQIRSKSGIESALDAARDAAGLDRDEWGPDTAISKGRPESLIGNELMEFSRLVNAFDPDQPRDEEGQWTDGGGDGGQTGEYWDSQEDADGPELMKEKKQAKSGAKQTGKKLTPKFLASIEPDYDKVADPTLREHIKNGVSGYYDGDFADMNGMLRGTSSGDSRLNTIESTTARVDGMKKAFDHVGHELQKDAMVHRVVRDMPMDVTTPGTVFQDRGFVSTTSDKEFTQKSFLGGTRTVFNIRVPKGTKVIAGYGGKDIAKEVTLNAGTKFKVISSRKQGGDRIVDLEVVR